MAANNITLENYLSLVFRPDCDFVEGAVLERNVGEYDHSRTLSALISRFHGLGGIMSLISVRVRVAAQRVRVPDMCLISRDQPEDHIIQRPPLLAIEVLSPDDRVIATQNRIDDFLAMGVPEVWVIHPAAPRAWVYSNTGMKESRDGILRFRGEEISIAALLED